MRPVLLGGLSMAAIALAAPGASAQFHHRYPPVYAAPYEAAPVYYSERVPAFYCVRECTQDTSPCDPPEYKRTDARCTSPSAGAVR
ncbi:MAG TPA: hypothetical protein PKA55_16595 [Rhodoblastus sp.]|nr:hypothetical protein [Rhodoblastus sp.]